MTQLHLISWNINSVRLRINRVIEFAKREGPDIICLQEIKCREGEFPFKAFNKAGYDHIEISGQKGYHGVATISRRPIERVETPDFCMHGEARGVAVKIDDLELHNLYVPAGGDEPDATANPKFAHKLDFIGRMGRNYKSRRASANEPLVVVGDLNIAPEEQDVWSHKQLLKVVSHTPVETEGLKKIISEGGFTDIARAARGMEDKLYTWWSYRARDWKASNRGRRLDHIWSNETASPLVDLTSFSIHETERGGEKPSDHCPVGVRLGL